MSIQHMLYQLSESEIGQRLSDPNNICRSQEKETEKLAGEEALASARSGDDESLQDLCARVNETSYEVRGTTAIQFLLTGKDSEGNTPLHYLLRGGQFIETPPEYGVGECEGGFRLLWPHEVQSWDAALSELTEDDLTRKYDPVAAREFLIDIDRIEDADDLWESFRGLKAFIRKTAQKQMGLMIVTI